MRRRARRYMARGGAACSLRMARALACRTRPRVAGEPDSRCTLWAATYRRRRTATARSPHVDGGRHLCPQLGCSACHAGAARLATSVCHIRSCSIRNLYLVPHSCPRRRRAKAPLATFTEAIGQPCSEQLVQRPSATFKAARATPPRPHSRQLVQRPLGHIQGSPTRSAVGASPTCNAHLQPHSCPAAESHSFHPPACPPSTGRARCTKSLLLGWAGGARLMLALAGSMSARDERRPGGNAYLLGLHPDTRLLPWRNSRARYEAGLAARPGSR